MKRTRALITEGRLTEDTAIASDVHLRRQPLALCLVVALAGQAGISDAAPHVAARVPLLGMAIPSAPTHATAQTWTVKNCNNSGIDSLRDLIENPMNAKSGDVVDLSELPGRCGMVDSVITLESEIVITQDDLTLQGPTQGTVTISAAHTSRVLHHTGAGTLALNALKVSDGYYHTAAHAYGGCIESDSGDVFLSHTAVSDCIAMSDNMNANGGGIEALTGNVTLIASQVSGNQTTGGSWGGWGGGIYSRGTTIAWYTSISGNLVHDGANSVGEGGGVATRGGITLIASTIDSNTGGYGGGLAVFGSTTIVNSTISNNTATSQDGGVRIVNPTALVANSTIAFNHQGSVAVAPTSGGVYFFADYGSLELQSSIIANNSAGAGNVPSDIYICPGHGSLVGAGNLVIASNVSNPAVITITADPKLGPLEFNGGRTRTRRLLSASPALGQGNVNGLSPPWNATDQRGIGYPRTTDAGSSADLGAVQFDTIFADAFDSFF
jgi:hypothetical protein